MAPISTTAPQRHGQSTKPLVHRSRCPYYSLGHDVMVPHVRPQLESAELLLKILNIPVVTQDYENGKSFIHNRLWHLRSLSTLILSSISYFIYSLHTDVSDYIEINDPIKIPPSIGTLLPNGQIMTMLRPLRHPVSSKMPQLLSPPPPTLQVIFYSLSCHPVHVMSEGCCHSHNGNCLGYFFSQRIPLGGGC
jgi:hypothetical protein